MKIYLDELDSMSQYYIQDFAYKNGLALDQLEELVINLLERGYQDYYDKGYDKGYEKGEQVGDEEGYDRGYKEGNDKDDEENFVKRDMYDDMKEMLERNLSELSEECKEKELYSFKEGFIKGYTEGVEWHRPSQFREELKQYEPV
jgi:flagellar biosynthesis/type III secretory pathway protein FliH